ncbi:MAG: nucleoside deaminase [Rhodothermales bacterium]|nr:nucleoside deaminase [Rhodothermales bacterium]
MNEALRLAEENVRSGTGGPFGCVVTCGDEIVGRGTNTVTRDDDPTAHAEIAAIRAACERLGTFQLTGCTIYSSCEPCPMCMGAIYWARPDAVYFSATKDDAAAAGFDDELIYRELARDLKKRLLPIERLEVDRAGEAFRLWLASEERTEY